MTRKKNKPWLQALCPKVETKCSNCGEITNGGHYVVPSLGDEGFYACKDGGVK